MMKKPLHITNGGELTKILKEQNLEGDILTWEEMLCEGPTQIQLCTPTFLTLRKTFLSDFYDIDFDIREYEMALYKLNNPEHYSEINLWFEYDLFCHINLIAVINLLQQKEIKLPLYLICSGRIKNKKGLKALTELSSYQLQKHYKEKIQLTPKDIALAVSLWQIYNGKDHSLFKPFIVEKSSFIYLSNCLKAHIKRFPHYKNGLNIIEENILRLVKTYTIKNENHLLGYILNYQGYYGYGDIQLKRIINKLLPFLTISEEQIFLNRKGHEVLLNQYNAFMDINDDIAFGGAYKKDFWFNKPQNKLVKTPYNAY